MTGNRTSDFVKSNQAAGLGNSATTPSKIVNGVEVKYTWHHLDDFDPVTGECTMQLVETSAHSTVGMTHTGSVGQYKSFNGSGY
jgi:A nuclease of the HNH/ENDO VII superfamily with conserved WHH